MNETLRENEELARIESEALRKAREDISHLKRRVDQHAELMSEKDRTAQVRFRASCPVIPSHTKLQVLHDEISTLQLELGQIEAPLLRPVVIRKFRVAGGAGAPFQIASRGRSFGPFFVFIVWINSKVYIAAMVTKAQRIILADHARLPWRFFARLAVCAQAL